MQVPLWTTLRPVGNSWVAKLTILLPLIGYFIVFNDALSRSQLAHLISEFDGHSPDYLGLSVPPRVFQIYFALCFIAVASAMFALRCPNVIKRHASAGAYIANEGIHLGEYATRTIEIEQATLNGDFDEFRKRIQNRISSEFTPQEAGSEVKSAALSTSFDFENQRYPWYRRIISILYAFGFVILSIPAAKIFWKVCTVLYRLIADHGIGAIW